MRENRQINVHVDTWMINKQREYKSYFSEHFLLKERIRVMVEMQRFYTMLLIGDVEIKSTTFLLLS